MGLVQDNASQDLQIKTVWYAGTDTVQEGYALAYDNDDTNAPTTTGITIGSVPANAATLGRNLRGRRVLKPATAILGGFAGLVAASSSGLTGPCFVDLIVPRKGDMVIGFCKSNATKNSTVLGITNAGGYNLVTLSDATFNVDVVGIAYETADTSTTAGPRLVKFL